MTCALGGLASGAQATVADRRDDHGSRRRRQHRDGQPAVEPDPNPGNNTATEPTTIGNPTDADLRVTKIDSPDPVLADGLVAYTIAVENRGPAAASAVTLSRRRAGRNDRSRASPRRRAGPARRRRSAPAGTGDRAAVATLAAGATATFDLRVRVDGRHARRHDAEQHRDGRHRATPDPDPTNNTDTEPTLVVAPADADLLIVKTDAPDPQAAGAPVSYTFTVTNNGPATATNVTVTDTLPAGTAVRQRRRAGARCRAGVLSCRDWHARARRQHRRRCHAQHAADRGRPHQHRHVSQPPSPIRCRATTASPKTTTLVERADVRIAKTGPAAATAGSTVVYTLTVTNDGPSIAENVTVDGSHARPG